MAQSELTTMLNIAFLLKEPGTMQSHELGRGVSSGSFTEEVLQPVLEAEVPGSSGDTPPLVSENLPAPVLDLALLSDPEAQSLEDGQVKQGNLLLYAGSFADADEYFDALKHIRANPRFSLHGAEAVLLRALLSLDPTSVTQAATMLGVVEKQATAHIAAWNGLAFQTQKAKLTKAVATSLTSVKAAVEGPLKGMQTSLKAMVTKLRTGKEMAQVATTDDWDSVHFDDQKVIGATYTIPVLEIEEERRKERQRQKVVARCTAIQAEAILLQEVLQVSVDGESAMGDENWTAALKLGLGIRKAWNLYQSVQKQIEKIAALELAAALEAAAQQKQMKDGSRRGPMALEESARNESTVGGDSNKEGDTALPSSSLANKLARAAPAPAEATALGQEVRSTEAPKASVGAPKKFLGSKWFVKNPASTGEGGLKVSPSSPTGDSTAGTSDTSPGFWSKAKGFIAKKMGKRGEDESDDEEERRVRRTHRIDDSGWGSDEEDGGTEPSGVAKLWRGGNRKRSSRKSTSSRRTSRRSSGGNTGELSSQAAQKRPSAAGKGGGSMNGAESAGVQEAPLPGPSATSLKVIGEESGTPGSPAQIAEDANRPLETDPVLRSTRAQVEFGLGVLQVLVSLIPTKVQTTAEVFGFAGHRAAGLELLEKVAAEESEWAQLASGLLLYYHTVIMAFQPESFAHSRDARRLLTALKQTWRAHDMAPGALSALLTARHLRYDGEVTEALQILEESDANDRPDADLPLCGSTAAAASQLRELNQSVLYELGWCHLLTRAYVEAADVFACLRQAQRIPLLGLPTSPKGPTTDPPGSPSSSEDAGELQPTGQTAAQSTGQDTPLRSVKESLHIGVASGRDSPLGRRASLQQEVWHVDGPWGLFYLSLEATCRWEAGPEQHPTAINLMKELAESADQTSSRSGADGSDPPLRVPRVPFESHWLRLARDFTHHHGEAPLFPALEAAALWNGFQQMTRADLEKHVRTVEGVLRSGAVPWGNKFRPSASATTEGPTMSQTMAEGRATSTQGVTPDLLSGDPLTDAECAEPSGFNDAPGAAPEECAESLPPLPGSPVIVACVSERSVGEDYGHSWSIESEMLCKFLLGCCHKHLGETEKAADELAFAISVGHNIGGHIVPFACYELGSMLLQSAATADEGLVYLEKATGHPSHCFQGRLKFLVSERLRTHNEEKR